MSVTEPRLTRMARAMRHRGPDDEGFYIKKNVGLGHQRLSIIDLSEQGRQPLPNEDQRSWIVFNGEIYNYKELRTTLESRGHVFRSHTDTEVIIHLYEDHGPDCVNFLNGMFAFAIWDEDAQRLFAARDRFGIKPFYYTMRPDAFLFSSEIKALLQDDALEPEINHEGLADYLTFQFCLGDKTLFRNVLKLPPGHCLILNRYRELTVRSYWEMDFSVDEHKTEIEFTEELRRLLDDTVANQLRADVPVGCHLSGGLDSATVACLAAAKLDDSLHTFSGGFREGPAYDETHFARLTAASIAATPHEVFPTAEDFVSSMPTLIYAMDEPAAGPGIFPQYFVSKQAASNVKVVLGGQGGDELFGGYTRYLVAYLEECIRGGIEGTNEDKDYVVTFESILPNLRQLDGYQPMLQSFWRDGLFDPPDQRYFRLIDRSDPLKAIVAPEAFAENDGYKPYEAYRDVFHSGQPRSYINRMTHFDLKTLLPALLQVEDRTSMAVSLESRVPLLDHRIAELVASMPPVIKYKGGRSKYIFRQVAKDIVPDEVYQRKDKMGFPVPLTDWYANPPVRDFVRDTLLSQRATQRGFIRADKIEPLLDGEQPHGRAIWGLLCLELWMQLFIDENDTPPTLG